MRVFVGVPFAILHCGLTGPRLVSEVVPMHTMLIYVPAPRRLRGLVGAALATVLGLTSPVATSGASRSNKEAAPPSRDGAGAFRLEQTNGWWRLMTPAQQPFFSLGVC